MTSKQLIQWLEKAGPMARRANEEARRQNERDKQQEKQPCYCALCGRLRLAI
jgi:hypothetical protein